MHKPSINVTQGALAGLLFLCTGLASTCDVRAQDTRKSSQEQLAGEYRLVKVPEAASGFLLEQDGTYRYFMIYGSVDEKDLGTWKTDGDAVVLSSTAPATDPEVVLVRSSREPVPGTCISFEGEHARLAEFYTTAVLHSNGRPIQVSGQRSGCSAWTKEASPVEKVSIEFFGGLRIYQPIEFSSPSADHNHFVFRVDRGNYGYARFSGVRLDMKGGDLVLKLSHSPEPLRYVRVESRP